MSSVGLALDYDAAHARLCQEVTKRWGPSASVRAQCVAIAYKQGGGCSALIAFPKEEKPDASNVQVVMYGDAQLADLLG